MSGLKDGIPIGSLHACTPNPVGAQVCVASINVGIGSDWYGTFGGAVDNVQLGFGGTSPTVYNFEVDPAVSIPGRSWGGLKIRYR